LVAALTACGDSPTVPADELASIVAAAVGDAPTALVQSIDVELTGENAVEIEYWAAGTLRLRVTSAEPAMTHSVSLHRLRPASVYDFIVTPVGPSGSRGASAAGQFTTDTLPAALSALEIQTTGEASFPLLMMEISLPSVTGVPVVIDTDGYVVWYRPAATERTHGVAVLPGVGFAINSIDLGVEIVTADNEVVAALTEADAAARTGLGAFDIHHDVIRASETSVLLLVQDTSTVDGTVWTGEAVWEWDFESDQLERRWSSFDFMSPATDIGPRSRPADWLHANSLSLGPRGNVLMSLFWTHEVISIAADYQSLEWRLGGAASSFTVLDGAMDAGQHTAVEVEPNRVLLFDNGLDRPGGELWSRASELRLDAVANTAEVVWEYRTDPVTYAPIVGSTRRLENSNTVISFGVADGALANFPDAGPLGVYEATPAGGTAWSASFEGVNLLYRSLPLVSLGGETAVGP
jgi:hypothetical protein